MKKRSIIKSVYLLALGILLSGAAVAQDGPQRQMGSQEQEQNLKKHLSLTNEQGAQLDQINASSREAVLSLRNDQTMDRQMKMDKLRMMRIEREEAIKAILTEEQKEKYTAMQQREDNSKVQQTQQQRKKRGSK
jgi:periplasmic protein CpxP/Spy